MVFLPVMLCNEELYRPQIEALRDLVDPVVLMAAEPTLAESATAVSRPWSNQMRRSIWPESGSAELPDRDDEATRGCFGSLPSLQWIVLRAACGCQSVDRRTGLHNVDRGSMTLAPLRPRA